MQLFLKILSGMANQTLIRAVWSGSALFAYVILPEALVYEMNHHYENMPIQIYWKFYHQKN